MGETHHHHHHHQATTPSRLGIRSSSAAASTQGGGGGGGEIVEVVRGSHIVRATGRKDRHSKVCTAKGPRDRRVRLAAHTAIQFYDVQDRLGYDRPSKAVDWLIKKAKAAIDELGDLPPWTPHSTSTNTTASTAVVPTMDNQNHPTTTAAAAAPGVHSFAAPDAVGPASRRSTMVGSRGVSEQIVHNPSSNNNSSSAFLPPSMDSDAIADTIKSFFPMGASAADAPPSSTMQFHQSYPPDLLSRTSSQSQDLRLSLQSFQDPILLHHHRHHQAHQNDFAGAQNPLGFDASSAAAWAEQQQQHHHQHQQQQEMNRIQRMFAWNNTAGGGGGNSGGNDGGGSSSGEGGFVFNSLLPPPPPPQQSAAANPLQPPSLFGGGGGQSQFFSTQRGPLQSSNSPPIRAWMMMDQNNHQQPISHDDHHHHEISPAAISAMGFASSGGFSGFHIPARIHGEEEHDGISDKPSSASSNSRH